MQAQKKACYMFDMVMHTAAHQHHHSQTPERDFLSSFGCAEEEHVALKCL